MSKWYEIPDWKCHICGHDHQFMAQSHRPQWGTRYFCDEADHSCFNDNIGRYWEDLEEGEE